ncbi:MAG: hypothetical protein LBR08_11975 [Bacteroidales bacterium]|jgi:hypothetical protein|nr:hypothetical protein [Bacteroidales bacterium]
MQKTVWIILLLAGTVSLQAQTLAGSDELGRVLLQNRETGDPRPGKHVALFYFLWQGDKSSPTSPLHWDLHEIYARHPEVMEDPGHPEWGGKKGSYYFWGQPVYGYYRGDDDWVHLKNIQLLTDAGVDLLVIDATNRLTYPAQSEALMKAMDAVRAQGKHPPGIVFYTNTASGEAMQEIYNNCYREGAPYYHPECWFYLDGKPLIIGIAKEAEGRDYRSFFTFRESQWPTESQKVNGWPWISFTRTPQVHYNERGEKEIINVSVAQHPNPSAGMGGSAFYGNRDNWGRSYRNLSHGNPDTDMPYGYNFQEQWDAALKEQTPFIFVTGWNEWIAGRWDSPDKNPKHSFFCDQASPEYSRDIEPTLTAGLKDHYYMQMVNNIRRYKGTAKNAVTVAEATVGSMSDWERIPSVYVDYTGDTQHRHHPGALSSPETVLTNRTGRNDLHILKTAHDKKHLFFYAETVNDLTPASGDNLLRLYINSDRDHKTGRHGYDYRIVAGDKTLQRYEDGEWKPVKPVKCGIEKNRIMMTVAWKDMQVSHKNANIEFKWSDNMQSDDPLDWYLNGDAAPGGRFNCVYGND